MPSRNAAELTADEGFVRAFMMGVHTLFVEHLGDEVTVGQVDPDQFDATDVAGLITLDGAMVGEVRVRFPQDVARAVVSRYTGLEDVPEAIFGDAVGELCNVIVGRAKSSIDGDYVTMSPPTVETRPSATDAADGVKQVACETGFGTIWVVFEVRRAGQSAAA